MDGSIEPYQNTTEGAEIFFMCNQMFVPSARMTATCTSNGMWTPDPGNLTCTREYLLQKKKRKKGINVMQIISCISSNPMHGIG